MPESQAALAIILRARPYGEVDRIVTFLSREFGKLTGIAKGAKNSRRRFGNCLEPFTRVRVHFQHRSGASMVFMERCELLHPSTEMATPTRLAYGSYLVELVDSLTHEANAIAEVYDLLDAGLTAIESGPATPALLRTFEMQLLWDLGYGPALDSCGQCQRRLSDGAHAFYDAEHNLFLCDGCGTRGRNVEPYATETLSTLAGLQHQSLADCSTLRLPAAIAGQAAVLTGTLLGAHLPRPLKSVQLIAEIERGRSGSPQ